MSHVLICVIAFGFKYKLHTRQNKILVVKYITRSRILQKQLSYLTVVRTCENAEVQCYVEMPAGRYLIYQK